MRRNPALMRIFGATQHGANSLSCIVQTSSAAPTGQVAFTNVVPFLDKNQMSPWTKVRYLSTNKQHDDFKHDSTSNSTEDTPGPTGDLFHMKLRGSDCSSSSSSALLKKTASIRRTFTQQCNAQVMLISGGQILAAHASFDPEYKRARSYIFNHPVGSAVLSPVLISGLIGALVEAALPQSVFRSSTLRQVQPLIVGVEVEATIEVTHVSDHLSLDRSVETSSTQDEKSQGYDIELKTEVRRFRDREIIATGTHSVWFPNYGMI